MKIRGLLFGAMLVVSLAACQTHLELQYTPERYAKLRNIELILAPPEREYELVANVEGSGGRHTAPETMINAMIDEAHKLGADALLPPEFGHSAPSGQAMTRTGVSAGLGQFIYSENGRTVARGQAVRWANGAR